MEPGRRIASARIEAGYDTQEAFAEALGVSVWTVRAWERKKNPTRPDNPNMDRLVKVTGKTRAYLSGDEDGTVERLSDTVARVQRELDRLKDAPPAVTHPGIEALAVDSATLTRYGITPDELDLLLVNLRAGPRSVESTYQKSHHKPLFRVRVPGNPFPHLCPPQAAIACPWLHLPRHKRKAAARTLR